MVTISYIDLSSDNLFMFRQISSNELETYSELSCVTLLLPRIVGSIN